MYPNTFYRVSVKALIKDEKRRVLVMFAGGVLDCGENATDRVTEVQFIDPTSFANRDDILERMVYEAAKAK